MKNQQNSVNSYIQLNSNSVLIRFASQSLNDPLDYDLDFILVHLELTKLYLKGAIDYNNLADFPVPTQSIKEEEKEEDFRDSSYINTKEDFIIMWREKLLFGKEILPLKDNLLLDALVDKILIDKAKLEKERAKMYMTTMD